MSKTPAGKSTRLVQLWNAILKSVPALKLKYAGSVTRFVQFFHVYLKFTFVADSPKFAFGSMVASAVLPCHALVKSVQTGAWIAGRLVRLVEESQPTLRLEADAKLRAGNVVPLYPRKAAEQLTPFEMSIVGKLVSPRFLKALEKFVRAANDLTAPRATNALVSADGLDESESNITPFCS